MEIVLFGKYTINLYTEIVGLIALIVVIVGYFGKTRKLFYFTQVLANILLSTGFLIKGNFLAGIGIAIATARSLTFLIFDIKDKDVPKYLVGIFIVLFIANGIYNWTNALDLLSIVALITNTLFCQIKEQKIMKLCMTIPVSLTIIYDIFSLFLTKTILKIIELLAIIIFFIKIKLQDNNTHQLNNNIDSTQKNEQVNEINVIQDEELKITN